MARTLLRINGDRALTNLIPLRDGDLAARSLMNFLRGMIGGLYGTSIEYSVDEAGVAAAGTVTFASAINNDTITVGGVVLTGVTGTPGANQFKVGVSNNADAAAYAAAVNAHATLSKYVVASAVGAVVTLTAQEKTPIGNLITLASINGTRLAVSGAALTGGVAPTYTTYQY